MANEKRMAYLSIVELNGRVVVLQIEQVLLRQGRVAAVHQHIRPSYAAVHVIAATASAATAAHHVDAEAAVVVAVMKATAPTTTSSSTSATVHGIGVQTVQCIGLLAVALAGRLLQDVRISGRLRGGMVNLGVMGVLLLAGQTVQVAVGIGGGHCSRRVCMVKVKLLLLQVVGRWKVGWLKVRCRRCVGEAGGRAEGAAGAADAGDGAQAAAVAGHEVASVLVGGWVRKEKQVSISDLALQVGKH